MGRHHSERQDMTTATTDLVAVPVPGADEPLQAVQIDGEPFVALRPLCESLGVAYSSQLQKLRSRSWAVVLLNNTTGADGKTYQMALIDRRTMTMWLATLDENRVSDAAREKVVAYQREAADALDAYFNKRVTVTPPPMNRYDVLHAALDQIEAAERHAIEAKQEAGEAYDIATETRARLDGIEGNHDSWSALGYAKFVKLRTDRTFLQHLGRFAAEIGRSQGITPEVAQHGHYGYVNRWPREVWDEAAERLRNAYPQALW